MIENEIKKRIISIVITLALFMEAVDTTIINTAIPTMASSFHLNVIDLKIALISYLLSLAIFIPISGWLADKFGTRPIFLSAIAIFTISSCLCGFSTHLYELVFARFMQGLGGSLMLPVGRLIIVRLFQGEKLIIAMNRVIIPSLVGNALGPLLGGIISDAFSWRWIFWVNIPFGILNYILAYYWIENFTSKKPPFDWAGFLLFGLGLAGLVFSFSTLSEKNFNHQITLYIFVISAILLILYAYHSMNLKSPLLKMELFRYRPFRVSIIGNIATRIGFGGVPFLLPLFLQISLGFSAKSSGLILALTALGAIFIKFFTKRLINFFGFRNLLLLNTLFLGVELCCFFLMRHETSLMIIALFSFIYGIFVSIQFGAMNPLAYADIPREDLSYATSIMGIMQQVASSFGIAATALILYLSRDLSLPTFHKTFFILGLVTIFSSSVFLMLKSEDGENLINKN